MDAAERATNAILRRTEAQIAEIYGAALKQAVKDQQSFLAKIADIDKGKIKPPAFYDTPEKVLQWRQGYTRELIRKNSVIDGIIRRLDAAGVEAAPIIRAAGVENYMVNRSYTAAKLNRISPTEINFAQYDKKQIDILLQQTQSPFSKIAYNNLGANNAIVRRLSSEMAQATILGESQRDIIKRIRAVTGQSQYQARRVAQTERTRLQSQARSDTLDEAAALGVKVTKTWSARMVNTRDTHAELDGVTIPENERFSNGLMYPGDPMGDAAEVINCVAETTVIESSGIQGMTKSHYSGNLVVIKTRGGIQLTASPNHPILTDKGWVGVGSLNKGDNILVCDIGKNFAPRINPNKDDIPITIGGLFNFAEIMLPKQRVPGADGNFHGDIPDSDIEVVSPPRLLKNRRIAMFLKIIKNIMLKFSDLKEAILSGQSMVYKLAILGGSFPASYVGRMRNPLSILKRCFSISRMLTFGNVSDSISVGKQPSIDNTPVAPVSLRDLENSFPGHVTMDDVVDVIVRENAPCHLYNLQTQNGMYLANDIIAQSRGNVNIYAIVHNCHCVLIPGVAS